MALADKPLRRDAERNRELILEAARAAFAEDGLDVGLHEIAKRAGVGVGTVYRRFPDKADLIEALFQDRVEDVVAIAEAALAEDDAWQGLTTFLDATCRLQAADRGLHQLVFAGDNAVKCASGARERIAPLVAQLVVRAQEQGTLRRDVGPLDVGMMRKMVGEFIEQSGEAGAEVWPRLLAIALDGLRADREGSDLPGTTPSPALFDQMLTQRG
ncbi:MAG: TetR/AcrR family transcriptional regulator [Solirubrobacteraceae bacterium]